MMGSEWVQPGLLPTHRRMDGWLPTRAPLLAPWPLAASHLPTHPTPAPPTRCLQTTTTTTDTASVAAQGGEAVCAQEYFTKVGAPAAAAPLPPPLACLPAPA